jgi:crotonobetainyl-CoA:carnitine CoA-transferase CaiB-like acyl-CoA transferase
LLADLAANVIKVEPRAGDPARKWGADIGGKSL